MASNIIQGAKSEFESVKQVLSETTQGIDNTVTIWISCKDTLERKVEQLKSQDNSGANDASADWKDAVECSWWSAEQHHECFQREPSRKVNDLMNFQR